MKGISHVERLYTTPFGLGFVNAFDCQEIEELHDSLHFLTIEGISSNQTAGSSNAELDMYSGRHYDTKHSRTIDIIHACITSD